MECSKPGTIRDEELLAYLDGQRVSDAVSEHLVQCPACSSRLATYKRIELKLVQTLYRWDCPSNQLLGEYQLGFISGEQATGIKKHVQYCLLCAEEIATLGAFLDHDPLLVVPASIPQIATASPSSSVHVIREASQVLKYLYEHAQIEGQRIIATLVPAQSHLAFQRSGVQSSSEEWPRRYVAGNLSISIQIEQGIPQRGPLQLLGFVTQQGAALDVLQGLSVQLLSPTQVPYRQEIDELGNFVFSALAAETYALELLLPESTVVIEDIPVSPLEEE